MRAEGPRMCAKGGYDVARATAKIGSIGGRRFLINGVHVCSNERDISNAHAEQGMSSGRF